MVLRKWVCSWVVRVLQTSLVRFFQGATDKWPASVTKKNDGIYRRRPYEDVERSCGVTLFADDVLKEFAGEGHSG